MPEKAGPLAPAVRVHLLLLGKLHPRAVHQPHEGEIHDLRDIRYPQIIVRLTRDPCPGDPLVVEPDQDAPLPRDPRQAVNHPRAPRLLALRVVDRVQRPEGPRIHQVLDPLPHRHLPPLVHQVRRDPHVPDPLLFRVNRLHHLFDRGDVRLHPLLLGRPERLPQIVHLRKIGSHDLPFTPLYRYRFAFRIPNWSWAMMNLQMFADPSTIAYVGASR